MSFSFCILNMMADGHCELSAKKKNAPTVYITQSQFVRSSYATSQLNTLISILLFFISCIKFLCQNESEYLKII